MKARRGGGAAKAQDFQGVLFDVLDEIVFERAAVLRGSYAEALADAKELVAVWNADEDQREIRLADEFDCFVLVDGALVWSAEEAGA